MDRSKGDMQAEAGQSGRIEAPHVEESCCSSCTLKTMRVILGFLCALNVIGSAAFFDQLCFLLSQGIVSPFGYDLRLFGLIPLCISFAFDLTGLVGACANHSVALKTFALWSAVRIALLSLCSLIFTGDVSEFFSEQGYLRRYAEEYVWSPNFYKKEANLIWDGIQKGLLCCGLDSYRFWDRYRPQNASSNEYPLSCCLPTWKGLCVVGGSDGFQRSGCEQSIFNSFRTVILIGLIYNALLCVMAFIVSRAAARRRALQFYSAPL